jgi:HEAT repeat protein
VTATNPARRWKLISLVLAGCLTYSWWHGDAHSRTTSVSASRLKGPLRVSASALGISTDELVRQLFATKDVDEFRKLAEKLGMVGDDDTIDAVLPLLADPRDGVPEAIVTAFGVIASEHAVDVLIKTAADPRDELRIAAIGALGATRSKRAEAVIIETAQRNGDAAQTTAVYALGDIASEQAVEVLAKLASHPNDIARSAMGMLGQIELPSAKAAILALVDSPSLIVAGWAILELDDLDADLVAKLGGIVNGGESELVTPALSALANAGPIGFPVLRQAALTGALDVRIAAMQAMTNIDSPQVLETLRSILDTEQGRLAEGAAKAIASIESEEARELLISTALSDRASETGAVDALMEQSGPEVEQALLVIAKSDCKERWDAVEHLMSTGNADAFALAVNEARGGGSEATRLAAMEALAGAGGKQALDSLIDIVRSSGELKPRALAILGDARPDDPVVAKLLRDSVQSRDPDEAAAAAAALSKVASEDARDALVAALSSTDANVARNAAGSLTKFRLTDDMTHALETAAVAHPELKTQVMQQLIAGGSPAGITLAKQAITSEDPQDAYRAMNALESAGSPAAFDVLSIGARAKDVEIRAQALESLGNVADKRATDVVTQAIRDPDPRVKYAAVRALAKTGTAQARDTIVNLSRSSDVEDRRAAVSTLRQFEDQNTTRRLTELFRDPDPSVAYGAIGAAADRPEAMAAMRGLMSDANVSFSTRREAAQNLSYQGVSDPAIDALLSSNEYE